VSSLSGGGVAVINVDLVDVNEGGGGGDSDSDAEILTPGRLFPRRGAQSAGGGDDGGGGNAYDNGSGNDKVVVTSSNTTNPNVGYPHLRHWCGVHPFIVVVVALPQLPLSTNPSRGHKGWREEGNADHRNSYNDSDIDNNNNNNAAFCPRCYCYVCNAPALTCVAWADDHCHAHDSNGGYARRRETMLSNRRGSTNMTNTMNTTNTVAIGGDARHLQVLSLVCDEFLARLVTRVGGDVPAGNDDDDDDDDEWR
jgi:hypothetical protein